MPQSNLNTECQQKQKENNLGWRILFLSEPSKISLSNNSFVVERDGKPPLSIPLSDIDSVVIENRQISITAALLGRLASDKIAVIICDEYRQPCGIINPIGAHVRHSQFAKAQLLFSEEKKADLWRSIIERKITNQGEVLKMFGHTNEADELLDCTRASNLATPRICIWPTDASTLGHCAHALFGQLIGSDARLSYH